MESPFSIKAITVDLYSSDVGSIPAGGSKNLKAMEEKKGKLKVITGKTITLALQEANSLGIKKEDIVSIFYNNQYLIVYEERS